MGVDAPEPRLRVASAPGPEDHSPYFRQFARALSSDGVIVDGGLTLDDPWIRDQGVHYHALHLHWPEYAWREYIAAPVATLLTKDAPGSWRLYRNTLPVSLFLGVRNFRRRLIATRRAGLRIIWTVHNTEPHESVTRFDESGYRVLAENADLIIFHSERVKTWFLARYRTDATPVVMAHGNYAGVYPQPRPPEAIRAEFGLSSERPTVACLGNIRPYKGFDIACQAIEQLGDEVQLVVAGQPLTKQIEEDLRNYMQQLSSAVLIPRFLHDQAFADLVSASDAILLPYRKVTTSGALLAAVTLGRGVVASDLPFFRDVIASEPAAGMLVRPESPDALAEGIRAFLRTPADARAAAAYRLAARYDWYSVTRPVANALSQLIG